MAALRFLDSFFRDNCEFIHARRREALVRVVGSLLGGAKLNLSALGRGLSGTGQTKHKIKLVDRLPGNAHLNAERCKVFECITRWALAGHQRPVIAVDWSDLETGNHTQLLKAAVCIKGRALTLYEETHPVKGVRRGHIERRFLQRLATMVPAHCYPVIVTDAGYRGPWFRCVQSLGWSYVGRVRGTVYARLPGEQKWSAVSALHTMASATAACIGTVLLSRDSRLATRMTLYQGFRPRPGRRRRDSAPSPKWREPWVLVSNLSQREATPVQVVNVYRKRMQIEETFRDLKAPRWGFAMGYARSRTLARRANLALIGALALFALWLTGRAARAIGWVRDFQANTERSRRVLSDEFLGREVCRFPKRYVVNEEIIAATAALLRLEIVYLAGC